VELPVFVVHSSATSVSISWRLEAPVIATGLAALAGEEGEALLRESQEARARRSITNAFISLSKRYAIKPWWWSRFSRKDEG
jgi:hypothetical protein